ncbi:cytochrome-c peroxidase [Alteromonas facilis]|uniref:cytochrome-c peroxidase n=1 Tax=Alteromonas facilis TaxID=2048004 RepID=UPI00196B43C8|nr:cytochrome c peroxidase [Alteromonas facilis]
MNKKMDIFARTRDVSFLSVLFLTGCLDNGPTPTTSTPPPPPPPPTASELLQDAIHAVSDGQGLDAFILPESSDLASIPQDPNNPLTEEKVLLGQMLFHETAIATKGVHGDMTGTWSCASCHHADAGFKSGVAQGIGEGGSGFGQAGEGRVLADGFDKDSMDPAFVPDVQPLASPSILNTAFQEVMLWNGQFGNMQGGLVNAGLEENVLAPANTPKAENTRMLAGLETQAIAGTAVHRLNTSEDSVLQTNMEYQLLFEAAYPDGSADVLEDASKAIAAYERTVLANQAPFQQWLRGDDSAMTADEIAGANLFFGKAQCVSCHNGAALSSKVGASEAEVFMAIGFADFDTNNPAITGGVAVADSKGRGGFTGEAEDDYKFKVPQLYNLADTAVFGHGASFTSIRDVVAYKNAGVPQKVIPSEQLDSRFTPLGLTEEEIDQLVEFLENALYDSNLDRYKPDALPTGACFPVADDAAKMDLNC